MKLLCGKRISMHERDSTNDKLCVLQKGHKGPCSPWWPVDVGRGLGTATETSKGRKVVQLATMGLDCLFALCDDGTVWQMLVKGGAWSLIRDVPQEELV